MTQCITKNIIEAVAALKTRNCVSLNANNSGWTDIELFEIIKCMADGYCANLASLSLKGNHFSQRALNVLRCVIGHDVSRAAELEARKMPSTSINPQNTS